MTEPVIRQYQPEDIPALSRLWQATFGDSEEFIAGFFRFLPGMGTALCLEMGGEIIGEISLITDLSLLLPNGPEMRIGYVYALAVAESFRGCGYGRALTEALADLARSTGTELLSTLPATDSLYDFYAAHGLTHILSVTQQVVPAAEAPAVRLDCADYLTYRETALAGESHLHLGETAAAFQQFLCTCYGGGLFAAAGGVCSATAEDGLCRISEVLSPCPEATAAAVAHVLGCDRAVFTLPSADGAGNKFLCLDREIPAQTVWNITFS